MNGKLIYFLFQYLPFKHILELRYSYKHILNNGNHVMEFSYTITIASTTSLLSVQLINFHFL